MKKTLKQIAAAILAVIVLSPLSSCKKPATEKVTETEKTTETEKVVDWVKFTTFEKALKELLAGADMYEMALHDVTDAGDDVKAYTFDIVEKLVYSKKHIGLFVHCNGADDLTYASCVSTDSVNTNVALISYYVYKSLGLSKMDADAFYDTFAFFEDAPKEYYETEENGWQLKVSYQEDSVRFTAIQFGI